MINPVFAERSKDTCGSIQWAHAQESILVEVLMLPFRAVYSVQLWTLQDESIWRAKAEVHRWEWHGPQLLRGPNYLCFSSLFPLSLFSFSKPLSPQHLCFCPIWALTGLLSFAGGRGFELPPISWNPVHSQHTVPPCPHPHPAFPPFTKASVSWVDIHRTQQPLFWDPLKLGQVRDSPLM